MENFSGRLMAVITGVLTLPFLLPVLGAVYIFDGWPIFYLQKRVGKDGKKFTIYKIRTMRVHSSQQQVTEANDTRITTLGRWLRRTHVDEWPQLWNIIRGDMHWVGPRPLPSPVVIKSVRQIPDFNLRHSVKPGCTGLTQIRRRPKRNQPQNTLRLDRILLQHLHRPGFRIFVLWRTVAAVVMAKGM